MAKYFLSDGEKKWGPIPRDEVFSRLDSGQISLFDLICAENESDFLPIMNHPDFTKNDEASSSQKSGPREHIHGLIATGLDNEATKTHLKGVTSAEGLVFQGLAEKTRAEAEEQSVEDEWYTMKDGQQAGPFTFLGIVGLLSDGQLNEFDLVKKGVSGTPQKVAEIADFQPENLSQFTETELGPSIQGKSFRRAHQRFQLGKKILVFDRQKIFKVICVEMSLGGAGLLTGKPIFQIGQEIFLKFNPNSDMDQFDARGKIVSLRKVRVANREEKYSRYGIQFIAISKDGEEFLKSLSS